MVLPRAEDAQTLNPKPWDLPLWYGPLQGLIRVWGFWVQGSVLNRDYNQGRGGGGGGAIIRNY